MARCSCEEDARKAIKLNSMLTFRERMQLSSEIMYHLSFFGSYPHAKCLNCGMRFMEDQ